MRKNQVDSMDSKPMRTSFKLSEAAIERLDALTESSDKSIKIKKTYKEVFELLFSDKILKYLGKKPPNKEKLNNLDRSIVKSYVLNTGILRKLTIHSKHFQIKRDLLVEALIRVPQSEFEKPSERQIRLQKSLDAFENLWVEFKKETTRIFDTDLSYDEDYPFIDLYDLLSTLGDTYIKHWKQCNSESIEMDVTIALPTAIDLYQRDVEELNE